MRAAESASEEDLARQKQIRQHNNAGEGKPPPGPDVSVRGRRTRQCTETAAEDNAMHAALDAESKTSSPPAGDVTSRGGARWLADADEGPSGAHRLPADTRTSPTVAASINCLYQAHAVAALFALR
ncbi:hypothetical protein MRX96_012321 [Rhipicephalus microplus]